MHSLTIAQVTATFPPYSGGTGRVCLENARGLARQGHAVEVFTARKGDAQLEPIDGVTVHWLTPRARIGNAPLTPALLQMGHFDIVHLHYPYIFGQELVWLRSLVKQTRLVITYHQDLVFDSAMNTAVSLHHRLVGRAILRRAARLIVTSMDYGAASPRIAPLMNSGSSRVVELANGVDVDRFHPALDGGSVRQQYGFSGDDCVVLFVGGLDMPHYFKGVDVLLRSLARIPDAHVKLMIVGDGDLRPRFEALAHELRITERAVFCGHVPDETLPLHYAAAEFAVLPSTTRGEAFGIVLLEAMACGKPVIASALPGVRSVVDQGCNGLLTPPGETEALAASISALANSPEQRASMGARGRQKTIERYDWAHISERLESIYAEVLTL